MVADLKTIKIRNGPLSKLKMMTEGKIQSLWRWAEGPVTVRCHNVPLKCSFSPRCPDENVICPGGSRITGYFNIVELKFLDLIVLILGMLKCVLGWCLPKDYQKLESPTPDEPVHVDINVEILDILSVNDKEFSITMSMYFSVMWQESRIETNNTIEPGLWYPVSLEFLQDIWIPNVFIYNLKSFANAQVLKRLAGKQNFFPTFSAYS